MYLPPSANGFCLIVRNESGAWYKTAYWTAPFFALLDDGEGEPLLVHCESEAHASSVRGAQVYDALFYPVDRRRPGHPQRSLNNYYAVMDPLEKRPS